MAVAHLHITFGPWNWDKSDAERTESDAKTMSDVKSPTVRFPVGGSAPGPLGLGEVEDVDWALTPLVPGVVRDDLEDPPAAAS